MEDNITEMDFEEYKISDNEIEANSVKNVENHIAEADVDNGKKIFDALPKKIAEKFNIFVEKVIREYSTTTDIENLINKRIVETESSDMVKCVYDTNGDGIVNCADNGIFEYIHTAGSLAGSGVNGMFKAEVSETVSVLTVNGVVCSVKCGEDDEIELVAGCWYSFFLDGATINFKQGGAELDFKVVGGTTEPSSPKENMIWISTDAAIGEFQLKISEPEIRVDGTTLVEGDVWIQTGYSGNVEINTLKKNGIYLYIIRAMQWDGSVWQEKTVQVYKNGNWKNTTYYLFNADYGINRGNWIACLSDSGGNTVKELTVTDESIYISSLRYAYGACYNDMPIDLTNVNTITFSVIGRKVCSRWSAFLGVIPVVDSSFAKKVEVSGTSPFILDVSDLNGFYYIKLQSGNRDDGDNTYYLRLDNIEFN